MLYLGSPFSIFWLYVAFLDLPVCQHDGDNTLVLNLGTASTSWDHQTTQFFHELQCDSPGHLAVGCCDIHVLDEALEDHSIPVGFLAR